MEHKVLLIDPDEKIVAMLQETFPRQQILVADDEDSGIRLISNELPSVIILAVELKNTNGFSVCRKIKKNKRWREIPIILISSDATPETFEQHKLLRDRANEYLLKPFDSQKILDCVNPFLDISRETLVNKLKVLPDDPGKSSIPVYGVVIAIIVIAFILFMVIKTAI